MINIYCVLLKFDWCIQYIGIEGITKGSERYLVSVEIWQDCYVHTLRNIIIYRVPLSDALVHASYSYTVDEDTWACLEAY